MRPGLLLHRAGFAVAFAASMQAGAATFVVDSALDAVDADPGDGICADAVDSGCSLRAAIDESNASPGADDIELPAGDYALTIAGTAEDSNATGDLDITGDLTIRGAGADSTRIDGSALDRVVDIHAGAEPRSVHFEQLTIRNGMLNNEGLHDSGVGVRVGETVHLLLDDVVIRDNRSTNTSGATAIDIGGCVEGSRVRILDNRDTDEAGSASALAAMYVHGAGACLTLVDSEISGNLADWAGAILADDGAPIMIRRSLIHDNTARFAGAMILNSDNDTLLENVTISGNHGNPGAILNDGGAHLNLVNSTVTGNGPSNASCVVGGIQDVHGGFGLTFLTNTVLHGNGPGFLADDCEAATSAGGGNMIGDSTRCRFDSLPSDQLDVDPELGPLVDNGGFTRSHLPGSAAIDAAQAGMCPAMDQRGLPRPVDGDGDGDAVCDVGAVEVQRDMVFVDGFDGVR